MNVYVLSSTREGLPNTVLEAMAMEVPIVSTDVDGVREAVTHDREALLVPARNSAALAEGIERVLTDECLAGRLVAAARSRVENDFSFARRTADRRGPLSASPPRSGVTRIHPVYTQPIGSFEKKLHSPTRVCALPRLQNRRILRKFSPGKAGPSLAPIQSVGRQNCFHQHNFRQ